MALEPCRECGKQVSDTAQACPHCGVKLPAKSFQLKVGFAYLILIPIMLWAALKLFGYS